MSDPVFIYAIVVLNVLVQLMLMARLKFPNGGRAKYMLLAVGIPLLVVAAMRLLVMVGAMPGRVADQSTLQHALTLIASLALVAGPWGVTIAAILDKKRKAALNAS